MTVFMMTKNFEFFFEILENIFIELPNIQYANDCVDAILQFYGPRIGALYVRGCGGATGTPLYPMFYGGGQERGFRPG